MKRSITTAGLALALLCLPHPGDAQHRVAPTADSMPSLAGSVYAEGYRSDGHLVGAMVQVRQPDRTRFATVDKNGRYRLSGLAPGPAEIFVFHLGAHPLETRVRLPERGEVRLDLSLRHRVIELQGIDIRARDGPDPTLAVRVPTSRPGVPMTLRSLESSAGMAESGLVSALASREPSESDGALLMRGSTLDNRVVLLDGAPILTPFHVAGLIEPFEPSWLGETEVFIGGAPSPYPGGLSYLLDVGTRAPRRDHAHGSVAADGLMLRVSAEAPLPGDGGVLVGGRWMHGAQSSLTAGAPFPYAYDDLLVRAGLEPREGHELRLTAFHNREGVRLDLGADPAAVHHARWGNRAFSLGYDGTLGGVGVEANLAVSRYENRLPLSWDEPVLAEGMGDRYRFDGLVELPLARGSVRAGGTVEAVDFGYRLEGVTEVAATAVRGVPLGVSSTVIGAFAEWEGRVASRLDLRAGMRSDHFGHDGGVRVSPRISLRYHLSEDAELFGSVGLYHQIVPVPGLWSVPERDDVPARIGWNPRLAVARASHLVIGLDQRIEERFHLGVSGFVKEFSGLGPGSEDPTHASGMELRLSREGERLSAWLGYALSWFWEEQGTRRSSTFEGRHLVSAGIETELPTGAAVKGSVGYGAGLPWTAVSVPRSNTTAQLNQASVESFAPDAPTVDQSGGVAPLDLGPRGRFLRLDLEVGWPIELGLGGRPTLIRPYLKVMNALDQRDALFYYLEPWEDQEARPIAEQTVLPLLGVEWVF